MNFRDKKLVKAIFRHLLAAMLAFASLFPSVTLTTLNAAPGERSLNLYFVQTDERQQITFRRNGRYVESGLKELNNFLRDWRRNEPTNMDPMLFDLVWKVYQDVGATGPITVVSAYRSPQTNEMLRSRSRGVARNSQHTKGSAIDFYIKGVPLSKLREAAMRLQVGGVGYYPNSRSPFIHLDTAGVRAWPRMTRAQLQRLFPDGRTLHIPTNGVPISAEGRRYATAEWDRCRSVPCAGNGSTSIIAPNGDRSNGRGNNSGNNSAGSGRTLLDLFFGTNKEADETAPTTVAANTSVHPETPTQRTVTAVSVPTNAPSPAPRADFLNYRSPGIIPVPALMPRELMIATRPNLNAPDDTNSQTEAIAVAALPRDNAPTPPELITPPPSNSSLLAAYAPVNEPEPDAQRALQMLIERRANETSAQSASTISPVLRGSISTASLGPVTLNPAPPPHSDADQPANGINEFESFFNNTFNAVANARPSASQQNNIALSILNSTSRTAPLLDNSIPMRDIQFYAPDLEHVDDTLVMQTQIADASFTIMFEPDEADFDPATELGPQTVQVNFTLSENPALASNRFLAVAPIIISKI